MPRNLTLKVTDPNTGRVHNFAAKQLERIDINTPQAGDQRAADPKDGAVDLFVRGESRWGRIEGHHLRLDADAISPEAAKALQAAITSGGASAIELDGEAVSVRGDIGVELAHHLGAALPHDPARALSGSERPIFLAADGTFAAQAGASDSLKGRVDGLFRAAETADRGADGVDIFNQNKVSLATRKATLTEVASTLAQVNADPDMSADAKAQARSSAATVTHELIRSLGNEGDAGALKRDAFAQYQKMAANETVGGLKESMIFNAVQQKAFLPEDLHPAVDKMKAEMAPTTPPYDAWFKDGKTELNISYAAGQGEGFYEGVTEFMKKKGFEVIDKGSWNKPRHLQMKKTVNGEERTVNIQLRHFSKDSFKDIDDPNTDIVVYGGHSNLGGNTRKSLENAPEGTGKDKLIFLGLCSGKDNLDGVRKAFPEAQLVTTFNSSYFHTKTTASGAKQFSTGEDTRALTEIINGALREDDWATINGNIRDRAVGYNHDKELGNYLTPIDTQFNARFRDAVGELKLEDLNRQMQME